MNPKERLKNILLCTTLGPVTPYFGIVDGKCECGKPKTKKHKPGKHPRLQGWQNENATTDHSTIRRWFALYPSANFAIISGVDSVVLDLDVRPDKNGVAEMEQLETAAGQALPPTVTVLSGSGTGAKHVYFAVPPDLDRLQKPKGTKGIDFQRNRQGVIVPGSLHESGLYYRFAPGLSPAEVELAELPEWLLEMMRKPGASSRGKSATVTDDIGQLFDDLLKEGPPPGSLAPGRLRPDEIVVRKMRTVPMRKYPADRSHSDSHWAWTLARNCCHRWDSICGSGRNHQSGNWRIPSVDVPATRPVYSQRHSWIRNSSGRTQVGGASRKQRIPPWPNTCANSWNTRRRPGRPS